MLTPIEEIDLGKGRRWRCAYLMATVGVMKEKGVDLYLPPMEMSMGTGSKGFLVYIRDPDGTTVEFVEVKSVFWLSASLFMQIAVPLLRLYDRLSTG